MDSNLRRYTTRNLKRSLFWTWISTWKITTWLIIINIIAFLSYILASIFIKQDILTNYLALNPTNIFLKAYVWTLLTSMFLHSGILHLLVNMLSLYFIGNFLEMLIGKKRFIWFYLISGIFAGLFFAVLAFYFGNYEVGEKLFGSPEIFAVGASGAIFGIAGALSVLTPKNRVYLIFYDLNYCLYRLTAN